MQVNTGKKSISIKIDLVFPADLTGRQQRSLFLLIIALRKVVKRLWFVESYVDVGSPEELIAKISPDD